MCLRVEELRASMADLVANLDAESVPLPEAPAAWEHFDAIERLAGAAKTLLAPRVEQSREWQRQPRRIIAVSGTGLSLGC